MTVASQPGVDRGPSWYGWYVTGILTLASSLSFVDRQALALLIEPIKADLQISDTQISLLTGLSFVIFYVIVSLPVAKLADRANRRTIVACSILTWSVMTALCGTAQSFGQLFLARVGVGAGEGGLPPSAYSMISDYIPPQRLATALGIYSMGIYLGSGLALVVGGSLLTALAQAPPVVAPILGTMQDWQVVFMILATPGLILGLAFFTIREPERRGALAAQSRASFGEIATHLGSRWQSYAGITLGFTSIIMIGQGSANWIPSFFIRKFGWSIADVGAIYGPVVLVAGLSGALFGGFFASWLRSRQIAGANLLAVLLGAVIFLPAAIVFPLVESSNLALAILAVMNFFSASLFGGGIAALQELTPNRMRAFVTACYLLIVNLFGAGLGPTIVAVLTDRFFHDPARLGDSLSLAAALLAGPALAFVALGIRDLRRTTRRSLLELSGATDNG